MSGGQWDYCQHRIEDSLREVADDLDRFPKLRNIFNNLSKNLYQIVHDLDWDFSGDQSIDNDPQFEEQAIELLKKSLKPGKTKQAKTCRSCSGFDKCETRWNWNEEFSPNKNQKCWKE